MVGTARLSVTACVVGSHRHAAAPTGAPTRGLSPGRCLEATLLLLAGCESGNPLTKHSCSACTPHRARRQPVLCIAGIGVQTLASHSKYMADVRLLARFYHRTTKTLAFIRMVLESSV